MDINIVGGCYREICQWPPSEEVYGSAGRAAAMIAQLGQEGGVTLYTVGTSVIEEQLKESFPLLQCQINVERTTTSPDFIYEHPLSKPTITPSLTYFAKQTKHEVELEKANIVCFGMIEAIVKVKGNKVVYDPQNAAAPLPFSELESQANELAIVLNQAEAYSMYTRLSSTTPAVSETIETIAKYILRQENAACVVVKCGQRGAFVCSTEQEEQWVPAFETAKVYPIGSGDCFVAAFSFFWINEKMKPVDAARKASVSTAFYCDTRTFPDKASLANYEKSLSPIKSLDLENKSVYLAGPFFNLQEMWMINQARMALGNTGIKVFSPFHDVGPGSADEVVHQDIEAIEKCDVLFALFDGKDPGTLFEVGYAIKCKKPVVIFAEKASGEELKMFEGTHCTICDDYSTAIYKVCWSLK